MYAFQATRDHKWLLFGRDALASLRNTQVFKAPFSFLLQFF